ncbi:MAG: glycosyl hydrolase family 18 protein, partial [Clostridia bacterium]
GNHSNFYDSCKRAIDYATSVGIDPQKIDLGIPAYGRPSDMAALWPSYSDEAAVLGKFGNRADGSFGGTDKPRYYNSFQMVYDKVAYSLQVGIGGVMVWHYSADASSASELSLFGAIEQSIFDRKSSNMVLVD